MGSIPPCHELYEDLELDSERHEIRVIQICPGIEDEQVTCQLEKISLDSGSLDFDALSYVWGDPVDGLETVFINGKAVSVTSNLHSALKHLRHARESGRCLWVDAVCINQDDPAERAAQVLLMKEIYSTAEHVIIWLGEGSAFSDKAIDRMHCAQFKQEVTQWKETVDSGTKAEPSYDLMETEMVIRLDLCKRAWWTRLWVRQELVLSKAQPYLVCGRKWIAWSTFIYFFLALPRSIDSLDLEWTLEGTVKQPPTSGSEMKRTWQGIHPLSLNYLRDEFQQRKALHLSRIVPYLLQNSQATDPRDYIYGAIGLATNEVRKQIRIDYAMEVMDLYEPVACLMWADDAPHVLGEQLPRLHFHGEDNAYPSWVPDFGGQERRGWQDHKTMMFKKRWERPGGAKFDEKHRQLVLKGIYYDRIKSTYQTPETFSDDHHIRETFDTFKHYLMEGINRSVPQDHHLYELAHLKRTETPLETMAASYIDTDSQHPGSWYSEFEEDISKSETARVSWNQNLGKTRYIPYRLVRMLVGKFLNRQAFTTEAGFVGIGVQGIRQGDVVTFIFGSSGPLVLRKAERKEGWRIVGCAYVSGVMDVDLLDKLYSDGTLKARSFEIV